jgi:hypothetical protein
VELTATIHACTLPVLVGGDFNLIRGSEDKNNDNINWPCVHRFNECIADLALREIRRGGSRYTWKNQNLKPCAVCAGPSLGLSGLGDLVPHVFLMTHTILGSDHSPLVLSSLEELR